MRKFLVVAAIAALSACGGGSDRNDRDDRNSRSERDERDRDRGGRDNEAAQDEDRGGGGDGAREVSADLRDELSREARVGRRDLPRDLGNGLSLDDIEAEGGELIFAFTTTFPLDQGRLDAMRRAERDNMCQQPQTRDWFRRGAGFVYVITDSRDEEYRFTYDDCPAA